MVTQMFELFLPLVLNPAPTGAYCGLAMAVPAPEDLDLLGVSWWYDWTPTGGVPMLWSGKPSDAILPDYAGEILVFNEPNLEIQANLSPVEAAARSRVLRERYPQATLIAGGTSIWAVDWMRDYLNAGGQADKIHIHAYAEAWIGVDEIEYYLRQYEKFGLPIWVTEFNNLSADVNEFRAMLDLFSQHPQIERIAAYTNRQPHTGALWELPYLVELTPGGVLTEKGQAYREFCMNGSKRGEYDHAIFG